MQGCVLDKFDGLGFRIAAKVLENILFTSLHENVYVRPASRSGGADWREGGLVTATIKDVAREAKVSVASVSRALNGTGGVTPATEQRIREAATRLRYVPHGAARSLITRRTHTIGALLPRPAWGILFRIDPRHRSGSALAWSASAGFQFARWCGGRGSGAARDAGTRGRHRDPVLAAG